ncbi:hypothetical protein [Leptolyngbya ohadii]|uniref:hypothetical protein n=1 Tax=Leptolyngbya ohadii TaxID=1962290 RepID=UPI000B599F3B|nr:hypothetical protein [Leptolyngbya ohadii]
MKVIELSNPEFETLLEALDVSSRKLVFEGKTFIKDLMFSDRVYQQTVNALWQEGDSSTSCLIVQMQNNYVLWREEKSQLQAADPAPKQTSRRLPPLSTTPRLPLPVQPFIPPSGMSSSARQSRFAEFIGV